MVIKQPNGKFCITKLNGDIDKMNLTEEEYIALTVEKAKERARKELAGAESLGKLVELEKVTDQQLKEMGSDKTFAELIIYIPREPVNQHCAGCDFTTYAKCPNCGREVQDGIGYKDKKCKCGQVLKW